MVFTNEADWIGLMLIGLTNFTGSLFLTLLMILIILCVAAMALKIPLESVAIILLPILIVSVAYNGQLFPLFAIVLLYAGVLLANYIMGNN